MRTVAMTVASSKGQATVKRLAENVVVEFDLLDRTRSIRRVVNARDEKALAKLAREMQTTLDGIYGTNGDVHGYRQVIQHFED